MPKRCHCSCMQQTITWHLYSELLKKAACGDKTLLDRRKRPALVCPSHWLALRRCLRLQGPGEATASFTRAFAGRAYALFYLVGVPAAKLLIMSGNVHERGLLLIISGSFLRARVKQMNHGCLIPISGKATGASLQL